ncbi:hypothetical protein GJ496_011940 [Pomphorhynchus laevis]|nr:hypothetical protein GJ496_011940 [Pomphorhynchus laevis]
MLRRTNALVEVDTNSSWTVIRKHTRIKIEVDYLENASLQKLPSNQGINRRIDHSKLYSLEFLQISQLPLNEPLDDNYKRLQKLIYNASVQIPIHRTKGARYYSKLDKLKVRVLTLIHQFKRNPTMIGKYHTCKIQYNKQLQYVIKHKNGTSELIRLREAERMPWKINPRRNGYFKSPIDRETWCVHFRKILQKENHTNTFVLTTAITPQCTAPLTQLNADFTFEEIVSAVYIIANPIKL